jgi:hypothetical protein
VSRTESKVRLKLDRNGDKKGVTGLCRLPTVRPVKFWSKISQNGSGFATFLGCHTPRGRWQIAATPPKGGSAIHQSARATKQGAKRAKFDEIVHKPATAISARAPRRSATIHSGTQAATACALGRRWRMAPGSTQTGPKRQPAKIIVSGH